MGGQIVVHAAGTYYNHPLYIKTQQGSGTSNQVTGAINQGSNRAEDVVEWQPTAAGTYYYQCALHSGMNGQIVVTAQPGVLGQNGNFSDPTCQKDSPNRYIRAVNSRRTSGFISDVKGSRVTEPKAGTSRQLFPRPRTYHERQEKIFIFDVTAVTDHYVFTGSDRSTTHTGAQDPTININEGDMIFFNVVAPSNPFQIKTAAGIGTVNQLKTYGFVGDGNGVTGNESINGQVRLWTRGLSGTTLYYQCKVDSNLVGQIVIT